jgi:hypothetical protein
MPTLEEELRRDLDRFHREQESELAHEQQEEALLKLERSGLELKRMLEQELQSEAQAELAKDAESSDRAVEKLFEHMVEGPGAGPARGQGDDEEAEPPTTAQSDVRQRARDQVDHVVREVDDVYADGVASDFQRDAKIVIGEHDTHPQSGDVSGDVTDEMLRKRRRRARIEDPLALPEGEPETAVPEAPATESEKDKG